MMVDVAQKRKTPWSYVTGLLWVILSGVRTLIFHTEASLSVTKALTGGA